MQKNGNISLLVNVTATPSMRQLDTIQNTFPEGNRIVLAPLKMYSLYCVDPLTPYRLPIILRSHPRRERKLKSSARAQRKTSVFFDTL